MVTTSRYYRITSMYIMRIFFGISKYTKRGTVFHGKQYYFGNDVLNLWEKILRTFYSLRSVISLVVYLSPTRNAVFDDIYYVRRPCL